MSSPLEKRVHGLSASDLGFISREMYINGYTPIDQDDIVMYWYLGSSLYTTMLTQSFRAGEIEAQIRHIPYHGPVYAQIQYNCKKRMWHDMYELFKPLEKTDFSKFRFEEISEQEMYQRVSQRLRLKSSRLGNNPPGTGPNTSN